MGQGIALIILFTILPQTLQLDFGVFLTESIFLVGRLMFFNLLGCLLGQSELKA